MCYKHTDDSLGSDAAQTKKVLFSSSSHSLPQQYQAYPDAMTYTIPVWAAVLNRYVAAAAVAAAAATSASPTPQDDDDHHLYLPPWVPPSERGRILTRLPELCAKLEEALGPGSAFLAELLAAFQEGGSPTPMPFRPIWIKQGDPLWSLPGVGVGGHGQSGGGSSSSSSSSSSNSPPALDFIPIVCVSASRDREPEEQREHFRYKKQGHLYR
jgi:hypothetical protein